MTFSIWRDTWWHWCKQKYIEAFTEAATRGVLEENVFLEIPQNSQESTCARVSFLTKLQASGTPFFYRTPLGDYF